MSNYLIIGSGGREHALAWKLATEASDNRVYVAPGNPGIARDPAIHAVLPIQPNEFEQLMNAVRKYEIDLVIVGPEAPLAAGIVDIFKAQNIPIFGPSKLAAQLETSKSFTKKILIDSGIKTASYESFNQLGDAHNYLTNLNTFPIVVKADGLAAGKGVFICQNLEEANIAVNTIFADSSEDSGTSVVIEEFLAGPELSFIVITDGRKIVPFATSRDHKRLLEQDKGPNTGGMGAICPSPNHSTDLYQMVVNDIFVPLLQTLEQKGIDYCGFLYAGLMLTDDGPYVLEFNVRMGDPETQAILFSLEAPMGPILKLATEKGLDQLGEGRDDDIVATKALMSTEEGACCVVMATSGYPGSGGRGHKIEGIEFGEKKVILEGAEGWVKVFCAGVGETESGLLTASGGRVLGVTARSKNGADARKLAYREVEGIRWEGVQYRGDIGE